MTRAIRRRTIGLRQEVAGRNWSRDRPGSGPRTLRSDHPASARAATDGDTDAGGRSSKSAAASPERHRIVLRGVHFAFSKYNIRPEDEAVLDEAVESLKDNPNVAVNVNGYCDAVGSDEYNLKLSQERAEAVVRYLAEHDVEASRLTAHGYGRTNFVATNDSAEGRAQNRRDELVPRE